MTTKTPVKATENEVLLAEKFREFLHCWESEPGRAKQLAEELETLLPKDES